MDSVRKPRILECVYFGIVTNDYFGASEFIGRTDQAGGSRPNVEVLVKDLDTVLVGPSVQEALQSMNPLIGRFKRKRQEFPPMDAELFLRRKQAFLDMVPGLVVGESK